jgi:hypothetical protein
MSLLNQASLIQIPSGYKDGTLYSAKPINGDGDFTFSRATNGTRINSDGLIEKVRTNLALYSEEFDNAAYVKLFSSITANSIANPLNGATTADKIVEDTANNLHRVGQGSMSVVSGQIYTFSFYAKEGERNELELQRINTSGTVFNSISSTTANLTLGTLTVGSNVTASSIESVGNGWYRISVSLTAIATGSGGLNIGLMKNGNVSYLGDGTSGAFIFGFQAETGDIATDYIPTTSAAVSVGMTDNVPRLDYTGGGCPSLKLEPQRTNALTYSEQFNNAAWTPTGVSVTANNAISPSGYQDADTVTFGASASQNIYNFPTSAIGANTFSIYAKTASGTKAFRLRIDTGSGPAVSSDFTATTTWQRFTFTATTTSTFLVAYIVNDSLGTAGDIQLWGAQLEAGSYSTSYIPTYGSSVTRSADACYKTGISSLIGQTEGTLFFDANFDDSDTVNFSISDGTSSNYVLIDTTSARSVFARVQQGGVTQVQINTTSSFYSVGERLKCAIAYKSNDFAFYINGTSIGTDNSGSVPALDQLRFSRWNGALAATQRINQAILFPTRLSNDELAELTTL